ncbi:MAG: tetratricopeptide repeat protein [Pseudomonadota bacterium]
MRIFLLSCLLLTTPALAQDLEALRAKAGEAAAAGNTEAAIALFAELTEKAPEDGAAHYRLGVLLMDGGQPEAAEARFEKAGELGFQPLGVAYRLARIYARRGETDAALEQIEALAEGGFGQPGLIEGEEDYASLRDKERFKTALNTIRSARFPCEQNPKHHDFDFWIGRWRVTQGGQLAGHNDISAMLGHCVIYEQWTSITGGEGKSFNYYDPGYDRWRQIWISDSGTIIEFVGEARDGGIFYTAETVNPADASVTHHRFQFTQNDDGSVRQYWETSNDDKATWTPIWDGRYEREDEPAP